MYNPLIQSIQVLRLEKRPDENLLYLRDALLEYSTFPFDMQPEPLPPGAPIPVNLTKVILDLFLVPIDENSLCFAGEVETTTMDEKMAPNGYVRNRQYLG